MLFNFSYLWYIFYIEVFCFSSENLFRHILKYTVYIFTLCTHFLSQIFLISYKELKF